MTSTPMITLLRLGKIGIYWAGKNCLNRGLVIWTGRKHIRLIPLNRFRYWTES